MNLILEFAHFKSQSKATYCSVVELRNQQHINVVKSMSMSAAEKSELRSMRLYRKCAKKLSSMNAVGLPSTEHTVDRACSKN